MIGYGDAMTPEETTALQGCTAGDGSFVRADKANLAQVFKGIARKPWRSLCGGDRPVTQSWALTHGAPNTENFSLGQDLAGLLLYPHPMPRTTGRQWLWPPVATGWLP